MLFMRISLVPACGPFNQYLKGGKGKSHAVVNHFNLRSVHSTGHHWTLKLATSNMGGRRARKEAKTRGC